MPQKYSQYDFKLAWDQKVTDNEIIIDGLIWNVRWFYAEGVEVWVSLIDPTGQMQSREVDLIIPHILGVQEKAHFSIKIKAKPQPGSKLLFTYRYYGVDSIDDAAFLVQSFEHKL
ncbi:MAG: hypothetical protein WCP33_06840 [Deltaproteobacteria bacterium]